MLVDGNVVLTIPLVPKELSSEPSGFRRTRLKRLMLKRNLLTKFSHLVE